MLTELTCMMSIVAYSMQLSILGRGTASGLCLLPWVTHNAVIMLDGTAALYVGLETW